MSNGGFDDQIWDEHQWEAHLDEIERKNAQLRKFIAPDTSSNVPRWITLLKENDDKHDAVDAFIEEELKLEDAYFADDDEDWEEDIDDLDDFFGGDFEDDPFFLDEFDDDFDDGEEWKELSDNFAMSNQGSIETLHIYNESRELAAYILNWSEGIHPKYLSPHYNNFVSNILKIGAKIAGGYSFGFEQEFLGGNIAYTKKGLYCANEALHLLQDELKSAPFLSREHYGQIHGRLFELRNDIGIYVQDLRDRFKFGLE